MRILNCGNNYHITGGSDKIFFQHAEMLRQKNIEVIPFAPNDEEKKSTRWAKYFPDAIDVKNPKLLQLPKFFFNFDAYRQLNRLLAAKTIDIAHLHIYYGRLTASILLSLKKHNIPVVQTLHDYKLICPNSNLLCNEKICEACQGDQFWRAWTKKCNDDSFLKTTAIVLESYISNMLGDRDKIDHFIAVSHFLKDKLVEFGVDSSKISTIHNPVESSNYIPDFEPGNYILYFGRLDRIKGIKYLIQAVKELQTELLIIGEGDDRAFLEQEAKGNKNIHFLGFKSGNELNRLIKNAACTVCPSVCYDIFPTTILESFALGKPVIGSEIGGIPELIEHEKNGFLFEPGNIQQLKEHLKFVTSHPKLTREMGVQGRKKVERQFNKQVYIDKIMKIYNKVKT